MAGFVWVTFESLRVFMECRIQRGHNALPVRFTHSWHILSTPHFPSTSSDNNCHAYNLSESLILPLIEHR